MGNSEGFKFDGKGKLARIDTFTTGKGKQILTLIFKMGGQYPQMIPVKVFGRLADCASEWKPGTILEVTGRLGGRDWNGKVYPDIVAESVEVVGQKELPMGKHTEPPPPGDDDVPF